MPSFDIGSIVSRIGDSAGSGTGGGFTKSRALSSLGIDAIVSKVLKIKEGDSKSEINIAVFVDQSVGVPLRSVARRLLVPATSDVKIHVESYYDDPCVADDRADLTLIIANASPWTGATYEISKSIGIPTVVMAERIEVVVSQAQLTGFDIDYGNIVSLEIAEMPPVTLPGDIGDVIAKVPAAVATAVKRVADVLMCDVPSAIVGRPLLKPLAKTLGECDEKREEHLFEALFEHFGDWVVRNCPTLRKTFVAAYEFAVRGYVDLIVRNTVFKNAMVAAVFFTPGSDFTAMTLNEIKMLVEVERAYGYRFDKVLVAEALGVVVLAFVLRAMARRLCKPLPMFDWIIKTAYAYASTRVLGAIITCYVQAGRELPAPIAQVVSQAGALVGRSLPGPAGGGRPADAAAPVAGD